MAAGLQIHVRIRDDVIVDGAYGMARPGVALTAETPSIWFCASKVLGALAAAALWEQGSLDLDSPVMNHVPEFCGGGKEAITVRHLLTHSAGLHAAGPDHTPYLVAPRELLRRTFEMALPRGWDPERRAAYSPYLGWFVLAELVASVAGVSFERFVNDAVLNPSGATSTAFGLDDDNWDRWRGRLPQLTQHGSPKEAAVQRLFDSKAVWTTANPANAAIGPARDLGAVYASLATGLAGRGSFLRRATIEALVATQRSDVFDETYGRATSFGLGVMTNLRSWDTGPTLSHRSFGHSGFGAALGLCDPESGLVVAMTANSVDDIFVGGGSWYRFISPLVADLAELPSGR